MAHLPQDLWVLVVHKQLQQVLQVRDRLPTLLLIVALQRSPLRIVQFLLLLLDLVNLLR